jgi:zinc transporter, ZIP family
MEPVIIIILITVAGPVIGSLIGVIKKPSEIFMYNMLAFAAGVMLAISFLELIPESIELSSVWVCCIGIVAGTLVMYALDKLIPHIHPGMCRQEQGKNLKNAAIFLLLGIFMHNFPEGMAIGIGAVGGFGLSITIALAIALHDIPEGICTSSPYYHVTGKRLKSFLLSTSTAIPTIVGYLVATVLFQSIPLQIVGAIIAATAGIMIYISGDELIPVSCNGTNGFSHSTIFSLMLGVLLVIILGLI